MLIINNKRFAANDMNLEERKGSDKDVLDLWETFEELGYLIRKAEDLTSTVRISVHRKKLIWVLPRP